MTNSLQSIRVVPIIGRRRDILRPLCNGGEGKGGGVKSNGKIKKGGVRGSTFGERHLSLKLIGYVTFHM